MDAPASEDWSQVSDPHYDEYWTDEVQGVVWDGAHWIFSTNANQNKPYVRNKALYTFVEGVELKDDKWMFHLDYKDVPHPVSGLHESDDHWGQICLYQGSEYVSHFFSGGPPAIQGQGNVVVFKNNGGVLAYDRWIKLDKVPRSGGEPQKVEFQAINPWDGMLYTCFGDGVIDELFIHDMRGHYTGRTFKLNPPMTQVQGACFSPNGHLYIASNAHLPGEDERQRELDQAHNDAYKQWSDEGQNGPAPSPQSVSFHQTIWYYSALNGQRLGVIGVLAEQRNQELEGICYGTPTAPLAQIHAVLLENRDVPLDNIFFKSFAATRPDLV